MSSEFVTRIYRNKQHSQDLVYFRIQVKETDLAIGINRDRWDPSLMQETEHLVIKLRGDLENYITWHPEFRSSLEPVFLLSQAPAIARKMAQAAVKAGVGPMAAVAGAIAEEVGSFLGGKSDNVIVENGGDLFIKTNRQRLVGIFAGNSSFSNRIAIQVKPDESPLGICTSSGTVGPSLSFGKADAALVKAQSAYLADAVASGVGNRVRDKNHLMSAIDYGRTIEGVLGILVIMDDQMAAWGDIELVPLS